MKKFLLSTAMIAALSAVTYADTLTLSLGGEQSTTMGTEFSGVGSSSRAGVESNNFGGATVSVHNDLSVINLQPRASKGSEVVVGEARVDGLIDVQNERSVTVTGSMLGRGQVTGAGSTSTTFDAKLLSSAKSTTDLSLAAGSAESGIAGSYEATGMARLSGASATSAGFQLTGASDDFSGTVGTTVVGGFDAEAGYLQESNSFDYMQLVDDNHDYTQNADVKIDVTPTDFDLIVPNLGGGSAVLTGANSDLFSGATLATTDSSVTITLDVAELCALTSSDASYCSI